MQTALSLKHYPYNLQDRLQSILTKMTSLDKKYKRLWCPGHPVTAFRYKKVNNGRLVRVVIIMIQMDLQENVVNRVHYQKFKQEMASDE